MPTEVEPPELARLVDFAERSRTGDWSLRSALCRYAQPEPQRVSDVLTEVRRIEFAVQGRLAKVVEKDGPRVWEAYQGDEGSGDVDPVLLGLLLAMADLDELGDRLADWAANPSGANLNDEIDSAVAEVARRLDELGVAREERTRPASRRG